VSFNILGGKISNRTTQASMHVLFESSHACSMHSSAFHLLSTFYLFSCFPFQFSAEKNQDFSRHFFRFDST